MTNATQIEYFEGEDKQWYWRAKAANGEIVAESEGYSSLQHAQTAGSATFPDVLAVITNHN